MSDPSDKRPVAPVNLGFLAEVIRQVRLAWRLLFDPRVPLWSKAVVPASLAYAIFPFDFVPDVLPGLGQLDDLAVIVLGIKLFIDLCPPAVVREHLQELLSESNWQVEEPSQAGWRVDADAPSSPSSPPQVIDAPYEIKKDA